MVEAGELRLVLDGYGSFLGMEKGCFVVRDKDGSVERYPLFEKEIGEVVLKSGNTVSVGALASLGFWGVDVVILTRKGRPVAMVKSLDDDSHVETRLYQYEVVSNGKGLTIAKEILLSKMKGENLVLSKYGVELHDLKVADWIEAVRGNRPRARLMSIEGKFTRRYFREVLKLMPDELRPESRKTFKAYDGINNTFNLAYTVLSWKVHRALIKAKLEPYLGFLHSVEYGKPALVCDFEEIYRYLIDDFLIGFCGDLKKRDFTVKWEQLTRKKKAKREYLNGPKTRELIKELYDDVFESMVEIPRIRIGRRQTVETLIKEEAMLLAKYLRKERKTWSPRVGLQGLGLGLGEQNLS